MSFRNALKVLPYLAVPLSLIVTPDPLSASGLTDTAAPILGGPSVTGAAGRSMSEDSRQGADNAQLLFQLEQLQQEMQQLRNLVEQQQQVITQLQKDGRDRYLDADRRLTDLSQQVAGLQKGSTKNSNASGSADSADSDVLPTLTGSAKDDYQAAYSLVKEQKFDQAITAYQGFIKNHPQSSLIPNAYYWLGELYMVKNLTQEAERAFLTVVEAYSKSRKVPDASYKLGLVYSRYGQADKAKEQMTAVKSQFPDSTAAKLAAQFLAAQKK